MPVVCMEPLVLGDFLPRLPMRRIVDRMLFGGLLSLQGSLTIEEVSRIHAAYHKWEMRRASLY